ncbi:hypothetical protein NDU88_008143 [Pleurodeles waltl]|uniref:Uncharacterized protein n=1 Tax=Pleurodeles waltl TaxID=8319 RepID=A0AAV7RWT0_PLEWA|nr:hypothetical protein NDU88_008143 [Pleurodeles waltl]
MADRDQPATMKWILQEITAVSRMIEGMDASISSLTLETKSIRTDIASFHSRVTGLEHRVGTLETHMSTIQDKDQDLSYLRSKVTDLEDRIRRDNIRILGILENEEGPDMQAFLSSVIPKLTSLSFDPPLESQRAHRVGPKRPDGTSRPRPIIACLLHHTQTRQLLQVAQTHGPFRVDKYEVRISAAYSKDTNERRKAFLALRPRLRQLEMKYGLFDPARMWVTKNGVSKDFYNPEDLRLFLDSFQHPAKDPATSNRPQDTMEDDGYIPSSGPEKGNMDQDKGDSYSSYDAEELENAQYTVCSGRSPRWRKNPKGNKSPEESNTLIAGDHGNSTEQEFRRATIQEEFNLYCLVHLQGAPGLNDRALCTSLFIVCLFCQVIKARRELR